MSAAAALIDALRRGGLSVAGAESLTGGLLCAELTAVPGASEVFRGGVVAYATDLKSGLLGVDAGLLAEGGPVHPAVASAMADGVRYRLDADVGIATTGVAGPTPQGGAPVGRVYIAVSTPPVRHVEELTLPGDRAAIRAESVRRAIDLAASVL